MNKILKTVSGNNWRNSLGVRIFSDLRFWQLSRQWSKQIFHFTQTSKFETDRRLVAQSNDSSESVFANIAEGFGRGTQGEFIQCLGYSIGSLNETQTHLCAAYDRELISKQGFGKLFQDGTEIRKMTVAFIQSMTKRGSGVKNRRKHKSWSEETWERIERMTGRPRPEFF